MTNLAILKISLALVGGQRIAALDVASPTAGRLTVDYACLPAKATNAPPNWYLGWVNVATAGGTNRITCALPSDCPAGAMFRVRLQP